MKRWPIPDYRLPLTNWTTHYNHLAMADRGALRQEDSRRGMAGKFDGSHMARHTLEMHPGNAPKFGMTIVRTYASSFTLAMGELIRILYRSKEKGVVLLNSKAGDFAAYSLPRLSVMNWEEEQKPSSSNSSGSNLCHRDESRNGSNSDLRVKPKVKFKTPCFLFWREGKDDAGEKGMQGAGNLR